MDPFFLRSGQVAARSAEAPEQVTLEWLGEECERLERVLRLQDDHGKLDAGAEAEIAALRPASSTTRALRLWAFLKHLYYRRTEHLVPGSATTAEEKRRAMNALLAREPIRVRIARRQIEVSSRSRAAMVAMLRHDLQRSALQRDMDRVGQLVAETAERVEDGTMRRAAARRRIRQLARIQYVAYAEYLFHSRAIYANALTVDGAPAGPGQAPAWWKLITPEDEVVLLDALYEGHRRYATLGAMPEDEDEDVKWERPENWGFASLWASIEREHGYEPATFERSDFFRNQAWIRASAPPRRKGKKPA